MNFLVVNDDGIESPGIRALVKALSERADVYVCAPHTQRSGASQSITMLKGIAVEQVEFDDAKVAWKTEGTPADCTKIGIQFCEEQGIDIDIVFSGVNIGSNLGNDTLYSGTVGAVREAAIQSYRAVALSVNGRGNPNFEIACKIAVQLIDTVMNEIPKGTVINVNTPNVETDKCKGVKVVKLGPKCYLDTFTKQSDGTYLLDGYIPDLRSLGNGVDVALNQQDYATVTTVKCDMTDFENMEKLQALEFKL